MNPNDPQESEEPRQMAPNVGFVVQRDEMVRLATRFINWLEQREQGIEQRN